MTKVKLFKVEVDEGNMNKHMIPKYAVMFIAIQILKRSLTVNFSN